MVAGALTAKARYMSSGITMQMSQEMRLSDVGLVINLKARAEVEADVQEEDAVHEEVKPQRRRR